jgi:hypothetical protein
VIPAVDRNLFYAKSIGNTVNSITSGWTSVPAKRTNFSSLAQQFRTVALAVTVTPSGPPATRQGIIYAGRIRQEWGGIQQIKIPSSGSTTQPVLSYNIQSTYDSIDIMSDPTAISGPATTSVFVRSAPVEKQMLFTNVTAGAYLSTNDYTDKVISVLDASAADVVTGANYVGGVDGNFMPILISIQGVAADSSFVVDVRHCIELIPNLRSDWSLFASLPPPEDDMAMKMVRAGSGSTAGSFFQSIQDLADRSMPYVSRALTGMANLNYAGMFRPPGQLSLNY